MERFRLLLLLDVERKFEIFRFIANIPIHSGKGKALELSQLPFKLDGFCRYISTHYINSYIPIKQMPMQRPKM